MEAAQKKCERDIFEIDGHPERKGVGMRKPRQGRVDIVSKTE
jgi:hypothetical protein